MVEPTARPSVVRLNVHVVLSEHTHTHTIVLLIIYVSCCLVVMLVLCIG